MPANNKKLTKQDYENIKLLLSKKIALADIATIVSKSVSTIHNVHKSESYEGYLNRRNVTTPSPAAVDTDLMRLVNSLGVRTEAILDAVNQLLEHQERKEAHEKVNGWKFGRSR